MLRSDFVKNTLINIAGNLPGGLVQLYSAVSAAASDSGIKILVVGAMARDLVLVHGYGAKLERGTRDVDFGIQVAHWDDFTRLSSSLALQGVVPDATQAHKFNFTDLAGLTWEIDIVPFGSIADTNSTIRWPPDQAFVMSVLGFSEALDHAMTVRISDTPVLDISVASPAGVSLLKLVAWLDREVEQRPKDALDIGYLIQTYTKIPVIFDAVYEQGFMEAQGWDEDKASAMKLGSDAGAMASKTTREFLEKRLFTQPLIKERFAREMQSSSRPSLDRCYELLEIYAEAFRVAQ